jgi:hypothetical protein
MVQGILAKHYYTNNVRLTTTKLIVIITTSTTSQADHPPSPPLLALSTVVQEDLGCGILRGLGAMTVSDWYRNMTECWE